MITTFLIAGFFRNFDRCLVKLLAEAVNLQFDLESRAMQRAGLLPKASDKASGRPDPMAQFPQLVSAISDKATLLKIERH